MPITSLKPVMEYARKNKIAHGAFNVNMVCQAEAVIEAHEIMNSCAIIQGADLANVFMGGNHDFMHGTLADKKLGAERIASAVHKMAEKSRIPVVLHLDHGKDFESCKVCIDAGYSSVMIDGSHLSFDENVEITREVVKYAHQFGVSVEGELGVLAGVEDDVFAENSTYTNPMKVVEFIRKTGADALALSYGTKHGAVKGDDVKLRTEICIASLENMRHENLDACLVSHGSSLVPQYIVEEINALEGAIGGSGGVPMSELQKAIAAGISKINMDTDLRLAVTRNLRRWFLENPEMQKEAMVGDIWTMMEAKPEQFDPRYYVKPMLEELVTGQKIDAIWYPEFEKLVKDGVKEVVNNAICNFGSIGDALKVEAVPLEILAKQYK